MELDEGIVDGVDTVVVAPVPFVVDESVVDCDF